METTTTLQTDELKREHCDCVGAIDNALTALTTALTAEKDFRRRCQVDSPDFYANMPALKFTIKLSTNLAKPFQFITEWRRWAKPRWRLKGGE